MPTESYKALILEDELSLGQILAQALSKEGIASETVDAVDKAIDRLRQQPFDIVISDIYLHNHTGQELFRYARENHPDLPFIFMTGYPSYETAVETLKNGAYDYMTKPFSVPEMVEKVKSAIRESEKRRQEKHLIDDLRQLLHRRMEELQIYQDIFLGKQDGLLILDSKGIIVKVNPGFREMSGLPDGELINRPISDLNLILTPPVDFPEIRQAIEERGQWKEECRMVRPEGNARIVTVSCSPIHDEQGKTFAYLMTVNDVTRLRQVESALIQSLQRTTAAQEAVIFGLARLAEIRDKDTGFHLERIRNYSQVLAEALKKHPRFRDQVTPQFIELLYRTAPLHDIGKVGIPDSILLKRGRLTPREFEIMKSHTLIGYKTLHSIREQFGPMDFLDMGIEITYCHHERYDGKGYPRGLKGDAIPLSAQIVAVADVYDALTSRRVYKEPFPHEVSVNTMKLEQGQHFHPELFDVFLSVSDEFDRIRKEFQSIEL